MITKCAGTNCGSTDGRTHSPECIDEHEACIEAAMTTDKQREEFERWASTLLSIAKDGNGFYVEQETDDAWSVWCAATAELETIRRERDELRAMVDRLKVVTDEDVTHAVDAFDDAWESDSCTDDLVRAALTDHITRKLGVDNA